MSDAVALARLWTYLKAMPGGFEFRRNVVVGGCVTAMCCSSARVVVDVARPGTDEIDRSVARKGYRVLRFSRSTIECYMGDVCDEVVVACRSRVPHRLPSHGTRRVV
jgi:very-short-patch-repair endonuclease